MYPNKSNFREYKFYVDIQRGSLERGRQMTVGQSKTSIFNDFWRWIFETLLNKANIIM